MPPSEATCRRRVLEALGARRLFGTRRRGGALILPLSVALAFPSPLTVISKEVPAKAGSTGAVTVTSFFVNLNINGESCHSAPVTIPCFTSKFISPPGNISPESLSNFNSLTSTSFTSFTSATFSTEGFLSSTAFTTGACWSPAGFSSASFMVLPVAAAYGKHGAQEAGGNYQGTQRRDKSLHEIRPHKKGS